MYRCDESEGCNEYFDYDFNDEDFEAESCAGMPDSDLKIEEGCAGWGGLCSDYKEAETMPFWMWPIHLDENMPEDMIEEMSTMMYWIERPHIEPFHCAATYSINRAQNVEWEFDTDMCDEWMIDEETCDWMKLVHTPQPLNDDEQHYLKIKIGIQGTSKSRYYFQYFQWDWDNYNMMMEGGDDMNFECPPDVPDCNDFKEWEDEHPMDCMCAPEEENCDCDMECPPDMPDCHEMHDCDP